MMNMMTGAVAINGGVGVMEIHQPQVAVSQMAESVAQAAEQVALNAHITLRELKGMEVVQLYFYKGMTQQEIAEEIGIGRRSVGNCLEGALKKIRKNF